MDGKTLGVLHERFEFESQTGTMDIVVARCLVDHLSVLKEVCGRRWYHAFAGMAIKLGVWYSTSTP